jgi:AcrR family transcriptional regulator
LRLSRNISLNSTKVKWLVTRSYRQRLRAEKSSHTRAAILAAARDLFPEASELKVEQIARRARVSVPTLYTHFESKGKLLSAVVAEISTEAGLFAGFERVWRCNDGESALRTMLETTFRFWQRAWGLVEFGLRVRRTDPELGARFDRLDESRLGHLMVICRRLAQEGRLKPRTSPARAARAAFALTTPYVYEALVVHGGLPMVAARRIAVDCALNAVLRPDSHPVPSDRIDWAKLGLKPPVT